MQQALEQAQLVSFTHPVIQVAFISLSLGARDAAVSLGYEDG